MPEKDDWQVLRQDTTGAVRYRFFHRDRLIGTAEAMVYPGFPVVLQQNGMILNSSFDPESTLFPGLTRVIADADRGCEPAAELTWQGSGEYRLTIHWDTETKIVQIRSHGEEHQFWVEDRQIAAICPLREQRNDADWEPRWCLQSAEDLPDDLAMLLMSFPVLRFAM